MHRDDLGAGLCFGRTTYVVIIIRDTYSRSVMCWEEHRVTERRGDRVTVREIERESE